MGRSAEALSEAIVSNLENVETVEKNICRLQITVDDFIVLHEN